MVLIELPVYAVNERQLKIKTNMLEKYFGDKADLGLVLYQFNTQLDKKIVKKQIENIKPYSKDFSLEVHAPMSPGKPDPNLDLSEIGGKESLIKTIESFYELQINSITVHGNVVMWQKDWKKEFNDYTFKIEKMNNILDNITKAINHTKTNSEILIEFMPIPLMGDLYSDPKKITVDPTFNTIEDFELLISKNPKQIGLNFDISHYGISSDKLNYLLKKYGNNFSIEEISEEGLKGVYPGKFKEQPSVVEAIDTLSKIIGEIQLSSWSGEWMPYKSCFIEGTIPGNDKLPEHEIIDLLKRAISLKKPISIEVHDTDHFKSEESKIACKKVSEWIKQIN